MTMFLGSLDRFGYELRVLCKTEQECRDALLEAYVVAYQNDNGGEDPREEIAYDRGYEDKTYYEVAEDDISIQEIELDKVYWY